MVLCENHLFPPISAKWLASDDDDDDDDDDEDDDDDDDDNNDDNDINEHVNFTSTFLPKLLSLEFAGNLSTDEQWCLLESIDLTDPHRQVRGPLGKRLFSCFYWCTSEAAAGNNEEQLACNRRRDTV